MTDGEGGDGDPGESDEFAFELADAEPSVDPENELVAADPTPDGGEVAAETVLPEESAVPDSDDGEVEPVEVLVTLAREGEIDPWDVDVVEVTDAFLARLDETDLRTSGRALFYSSVLLRMKSDEMLAADDDEEEAEELEPWEAAMRADDEPTAAGHDPVDALEDEMDRRLDRKSTRGSPETLDELVRELREAERDSWWKESRQYDTSDEPHGFQRGAQEVDYRAGDDRREAGEPTEAEVTGNTHDEEIEGVIDDVRDRLADHYERDREEVLFAEVRDAGGRPVMTFLALLFLAHDGAVRLDQDELFGDLWVRPTAEFGAVSVTPDLG
ncbi:MAG: segregation/condensation protein A [Halolamina sp.]